MHDRLPRCRAEWWSDSDLTNSFVGAIEPPNRRTPAVGRDGLRTGRHARRKLKLDPGRWRRAREVYARVHLLPPPTFEACLDVVVASPLGEHAESGEEP